MTMTRKKHLYLFIRKKYYLIYENVYICTFGQLTNILEC